MAVSTHAGMDTYNRILTEARVNGDPIGPKNFEYNHQRRQWEARQKNRTQLVQARAAKKSKAELTKAKISLNKARERIASKLEQISETDRLREKHRQLQIAKIADGYKVERDGQEIKSRGNGL